MLGIIFTIIEVDTLEPFAKIKMESKIRANGSDLLFP